MSTSTTTNLGLVLDNADEPVKTHHRHANENLATLDVTIKSLQDSMANAKALLGQLGIDVNDHYVVDAETARITLGVPSLSDIADVEDAVGDLASVTANLVTHDQFYFGYDEVNGKKMISIFKRGDI